MPNLLSVLGAGAQGVRQGRENAEMAQKASALFRSIGTEESAAFADLLMQDPRGASDVVSAFGGWNQLYSNLAANALNAQKMAQDTRQLDQGDRRLDLEGKSIEQQGELGREELRLREESLNVDRAALGIRQFTALAKVGDLGALQASLAALPEGPSRNAALAILETGKKPTDDLIAAAHKEASGLTDRDFERNFSNDFSAAVKAPREEATMATKALDLLQTDDPSGVSDIAGIYGFIKAIDSGSVVRSEEIKLFREALSSWEKGKLAFTKLWDPELMTPRVRTELGKALTKLRTSALGQIGRLEDESMQRAAAWRISPGRAKALFIGGLSDEESGLIGGGAAPEDGGFDPATASDADISAELRRRASGGR